MFDSIVMIIGSIIASIIPPSIPAKNPAIAPLPSPPAARNPATIPAIMSPITGMLPNNKWRKNPIIIPNNRFPFRIQFILLNLLYIFI
ncbi:MAG TPA: hypothetical protein ENG40_01530 [Thermoprotei archaeon]|nr:hypothetical protein [Thermoprotei archaeon]